jgi:carbon-monoxide dehydrogenase medium subunit
VTVGALVRQRRLELDADLIDAVPLLADAVAQVGYPATRNRGTIGGSLAHADPVAELPAVAVALGAHVVAVGPTGAREIACADLATGYFTTVLDPAEILTEVHFPGRADWHGAAWHEWSPRAHDFAVAGVGVAVDLDAAGTCVAVHAAACGIGGAPLPLTEVIAAAGVLGWSPTSAATGDQSPGKAAEVPAALWRAVAAAVMVACGGAEVDQVELTGLLAARAVRSALARAAQNLGKGRQ